MYNYDKNYISRRASEFGFIRDTLEKVYRLVDILEYIDSSPALKGRLALKGGTAINLTVFDLPRLSVDIDLDYLGNDSKDEMLRNRDTINTAIAEFMEDNRYKLSPKTKTPHSLDSWVYEYINTSGNRDTIKIEINYSLRAHIYPPQGRRIITKLIERDYGLNCLDALEIFGSKINALLSRAAARDLYDVHNMIKAKIFDETSQQLLRKCVVFYAAISAKEINKSFDASAIDSITRYKIRTDLLPVLIRNDQFDLDIAKKSVKEYISELMVLLPQEREFLDKFEGKEYIPELLFDDAQILARIKAHPMALWKIRQ